MTAVAKPHVRYLQLGRQSVQDDDLVAPVELDRIAAVLGHGFLLESPVQIVRFSHPHLSTCRVHSKRHSCLPLGNGHERRAVPRWPRAKSRLTAGSFRRKQEAPPK